MSNQIQQLVDSFQNAGYKVASNDIAPRSMQARKGNVTISMEQLRNGFWKPNFQTDKVCGRTPEEALTNLQEALSSAADTI